MLSAENLHITEKDGLKVIHLMKLNNIEKLKRICFNSIFDPLNSFCLDYTRSSVMDDRGQQFKGFTPEAGSLYHRA